MENEIKRRPSRQSPAKRNRKLQERHLAILLFGCVLFLGVFHMLLPDKAFSEAENRSLAAKPRLLLARERARNPLFLQKKKWLTMSKYGQ